MAKISSKIVTITFFQDLTILKEFDLVYYKLRVLRSNLLKYYI